MMNYKDYEPETWEMAEQEDREIIRRYGSIDNYYNRINDEEDENDKKKGDEIKIKAVIK